MLIQSLYRACTNLHKVHAKLTQSTISGYLFFWRGAARGLLGPLGSRKAYTKRIQSLQSLYKAYTKQGLYKAYAKLIQSLYKADTKHMQGLHKANTKLTQNLHEAYAKLTQSLHKT